MAAITANLLPIICLCFTVVYCDCGEKETPWVYQKTFVDGRKPFIEFTCRAYLKRGEWLTWYKEEPRTILTEIEQRKNGDIQIDLLWPLALLSDRDKILCVKECPSVSSASGRYTSYEQTSSKSIPIDFYGTIPSPLTDILGVMVTPDAFEDNGKSLMEFTCWAHLHQGQVLSWHQTKDLKTTQLAMIQQENTFGYIKIELQKTLEPSDKSTQLYCAKETVLPNATLAQAARSKIIPILFERHYKPIESPYVTVQPSTDNLLFDENDELKFVCGGSEPVDGRNLTWRIKGVDMKLTYPDQSFDKSTKLNQLTLRMKPYHHRSQLYCAQDYKIELQLTETDQIMYHYGELARSRPITLVHRNNRDGIVGGPWLTPSTFVDDGKPVIEFNCSAYLYRGELLTWYQVRESEQMSALVMVQQESYNGYIEVEMRKTLEPSDNGTTLFCVKERMVLNTRPVQFKRISDTSSIPLTFQRYIKGSETPYVTIRPSRDIVIFDEHEELEFVCSGSAPVDGRAFRWYLQGADMKETYPDQSFVKSTKLNHLTLRMTPSHHLSLLYCAQDYTMELQLTETDQIKYHYGELARSHPITLVHRSNREDIVEGPWLTPSIFVDDGKPVIEFNCSAYLNQGELLTWYQARESEQMSRLVMVQQESYNGYIEVEIRKTLEPSDNGTTLFCVKERMVPNTRPIQFKRISDTSTPSIPLTFQRYIKGSETPYVTIRPSRDIVIFDEHEELELVCGGSAPVDGRALRWYLQGPDVYILPDNQTFDKSANLNHLKLHMDPKYHRSQLYCVQDFVFDLHYQDRVWYYNYGELASSAPITLLHRSQRDALGDIHVTPGHYIHVHKPFMEFTCLAFSMPGDVLSWYQSKGLNRSVSILRMIQLRNPEHEGEQWMEFTLNKTLEQSDNGSEIYCAQQSVLPGGNLSEGLESRRISIAFQRDIKPFEPAFVTVEPNTSARFDPKTTLRLTCRGSRPIDGRTYTWFRMDSNSKISIPEDQQYDAATTSNVLQLSPNEGYHRNQLFCAQGFLADIRHGNSSRRDIFYGELVTSDKVTLIQRDKEAENDISRLKSSSSPGDMKWTILAIALPVTLATLAAAALLWRARVRRRATHATLTTPATPDKDNTDDDDYVTLSRETVTYAVLDLQSAPGAARAPPAPEPVLYAEITGVYRPTGWVYRP